MKLFHIDVGCLSVLVGRKTPGAQVTILVRRKSDPDFRNIFVARVSTGMCYFDSFVKFVCSLH